MNKGQILKVNNYYWKNPKYAICLQGGKTEVFLLEDGHVFEKTTEDDEYNLLYFNDFLRYQRARYTLSNTRNVPAKVRSLLEKKSKSALALYKGYKQTEKIISDLKPKYKELNNMQDEIIKAKGLLNHDDFIKEVLKLSGLSGQVEPNDNVYGRWGVFCSDSLFQLSYQTDISEKWANPETYSFLYREYDNTIHITSDKDKEYQKVLKKAHRTLPISKKIKYREWLSLSDKEVIYYNAIYSIELNKPLTKEYAKEVAYKMK